MIKSERQFLNHKFNRNYRVSYVLRRVPCQRIVNLIPASSPPKVGDLAMAMITDIGKTAKIEMATGRMGLLYKGEPIAVVFGHRYATAQFEGYADMRAENKCDLLSSGGVCGVVKSKHEATPQPTRLQILGYLADAEKKSLNLSEFSMKPVSFNNRDRWPCVIAVCGGSMDSGKTYTTSGIIHGLVSSGYRVGAGKLTGTAAGRDSWQLLDAGAFNVYDFVDCGLPSTFRCSLEALHRIFDTITSNLAAQGAEYIVLEIADGLLEEETAALLNSAEFRDRVDGFVYAISDPLASIGGVAHLQNLGIKPIALSGRVSQSPLAIQEVEKATALRCLTFNQLASGELNSEILALRNKRELFQNRIGFLTKSYSQVQRIVSADRRNGKE